MSAARGVKRSLLRVRVVPRAARNALSRDASGILRVHLTAPPVDDAANRALVTLLAERLGLPKRALALARGERGRDKVISVDGASASDLEARVERAVASGVDKTEGRG
jgi:uncharacterized protein YggU (UPF0235/DUF167 family)